MRLSSRLPWVISSTAGAVNVSFLGPNYKASSPRQAETKPFAEAVWLHQIVLSFGELCRLINHQESPLEGSCVLFINRKWIRPIFQRKKKKNSGGVYV